MTLDITALRQEVRTGLTQLKEQFARDGDTLALLCQRSQQVDTVLRKLWASFDFPAGIALAAVGGYGRGKLYPASDIDLLILLPREASAAVQEKLERLVSCFWDIGLEIGHSVRTVAECIDEANNACAIGASSNPAA
jgi:[protein-PII] uridylyltransferase